MATTRTNFYLLPPGRCYGGARVHFSDHGGAVKFLRRLTRQPDDVRRLRIIAHRHGGNAGQPDRESLRHIARALCNGRVQLIAMQETTLGSSQSKPTDFERPDPPPIAVPLGAGQHWFEVLVVDENEQPVRTDAEVRMDQGSVERTSTNGAGIVRLEGLPRADTGDLAVTPNNREVVAPMRGRSVRLAS